MNQIVVGVDESLGATAALQWAVREGRLRRWSVTAVLAWSFLDQHQLEATGTFDPAYNEDVARDVLERVVVKAVGDDAARDVEQRTICDLPESALLDQAADADLLVVGARGLGGFKSLLLGSVSYHLLHRARCPVVVVHPATGSVTHAPERIVVGVDGSETAQDALRWALAAARPRDAKIQVVHAWQFAISGGPFSAVALDPTTLESAARRLLDTVVDAEDTDGVTVERNLVCDGPAAAILDAARDADLVVVGSRGLGSVKSLLLGSVSHQVAHHAPCPVVVVPPAERLDPPST